MAQDHPCQVAPVGRGEQLRVRRRHASQHHPRRGWTRDDVMGLQIRAERAAQGERPLHRAAQQIGGQEDPWQDPVEIAVDDQPVGGRGLVPALERGAERDGELRRVTGPHRAEPDGRGIRRDARADVTELQLLRPRLLRLWRHRGLKRHDAARSDELFHVPTLIGPGPDGKRPACHCGQTGRWRRSRSRRARPRTPGGQPRSRAERSITASHSLRASRAASVSAIFFGSPPATALSYASW